MDLIVKWKDKKIKRKKINKKINYITLTKCYKM